MQVALITYKKQRRNYGLNGLVQLFLVSLYLSWRTKGFLIIIIIIIIIIIMIIIIIIIYLTSITSPSLQYRFSTFDPPLYFMAVSVLACLCSCRLSGARVKLFGSYLC